MNIRNTILAPAFLLASALGAQIPNAGFESWSAEKVVQLQGWQSEGSVTRVFSGSNAAARLEHTSGGLASWIALADFNIAAGPGAPGPAFVSNSIPDSLRFRMRWNLASGDTGRILFGFTENGFLKDLVEYRFSGSVMVLQSVVVPSGTFAGASCDSGFLWLSSNLGGKPGAGSGWVEVDEVVMLRAGNPMTLQMPNHRLESWDSMQVTEPLYFTGTDRIYSSPGKETDFIKAVTQAYTGNLALRLETGIWQNAGGPDTLGAWLVSSGDAAFGDAYIPSFPINFRPASFRGYSYLQSQGDTPVAELNLFYQGNLVGNALWVGGANHNDYRLFSANVQYDPLFSAVPDSATVVLYLSNANGGSARPGNYWVVDDLHLSSWPAALALTEELGWHVYPNPAHDHLCISGKPESESVQLQIFDLSGRVALEQQLVSFSGRETIWLQGLPAGMYTIRLAVSGRQFQQRFIITP